MRHPRKRNTSGVSGHQRGKRRARVSLPARTDSLASMRCGLVKMLKKSASRVRRGRSGETPIWGRTPRRRGCHTLERVLSVERHVMEWRSPDAVVEQFGCPRSRAQWHPTGNANHPLGARMFVVCGRPR